MVDCLFWNYEVKGDKVKRDFYLQKSICKPLLNCLSHGLNLKRFVLIPYPGKYTVVCCYNLTKDFFKKFQE